MSVRFVQQNVSAFRDARSLETARLSDVDEFRQSHADHATNGREPDFSL